MLRVGKWRCKELFSDGRRTCVLSHQRQGGNGAGDTKNVIWRVGEVDVEEVIGQVRELVKHSLYAALATPEVSMVLLVLNGLNQRCGSSVFTDRFLM